MIHEKKVERFYSSGSEITSRTYDGIKNKTWEFLSFGYWKDGTHTYLQAATNLLDYFLNKSGIRKPGKILSVACGYGTETFSCFSTFHPKHIYGIDITNKHVSYSNTKAKQLNLDDRISFRHGDACAVDFPSHSFSHVIGIEGPVHFKTRSKFFHESKRVLNDSGELILTDIILGRSLKSIGRINKRILRFIAKEWIVPDENWVDAAQYKKQLIGAGFSSVHIRKIGKFVFPGYARNAFTVNTIANRLRQRGIMITLGLTIISYMLGYLYKRHIIEYIFVKARV
jgi:ubiquinone/menaquinone biosynthesis C-methylase UbiE